MFKNISAAVNPWPLPIPDAVHALNTGTWEQVHELASHHRRGAEFFIDGWLVHNIVGLEELTGTCQCQIVAGSGDPSYPVIKAPVCSPALRITTLLIERQTHQSLNTCEIHASCGHGVLIIECYYHGGSLPDAHPPLTKPKLSTSP
jgi:hypothetical protein